MILAGSKPTRSGLSIPSMEPGLILPAGTTGRSVWRWRPAASRSSPPFSPPQPKNSFSPRRVSARHETPGRDLDGAKLAGPKRVLERVAALHPQVVQLPRIGALALRIAYVAHGGVDVAVAGGNSHDWDLAAADLLVHEAGGLLTDLDGVRPVYNRPSPVHGSLIAAGRERHRTFLELARNLQLA
jgi:fructose-1,6-bisphosphatase/inositol monophosphatase family enzyme